MLKIIVLDAIRLARFKKRLKQEEVAVKLNVTQGFYSKIENGQSKLTLSLFEQLVLILEIDCMDLIKQVKRLKEPLK
jgi:transcriptional regulator with XRE-family HTH domain